MKNKTFVNTHKIQTKFSQRSFLILALLFPLVLISCAKKSVVDHKEPDTVKVGPSPIGDVVGKLVVGYQGWFTCSGDNSPVNRWVHWGGNGNTPPSPGHQSFEIWPDTREFINTYQTGYANLGNGDPAKLYSAYDDQVVNTHFKWMKEYGIDCAALQRFGSELRDPVFKAQRDGMLTKVKNAAEANNMKFYVMYDISGWAGFQQGIKTDWEATITSVLSATSSSAYAKQNGKPVVCIWGVGVSGRPGTPDTYVDVINWLKAKGCYVIVGTHNHWRTDSVNMNAYIAADMISPWTVGSYRFDVEIDNYANELASDLAVCNKNGIDFQPVVFPGFAWSNWNRGLPNDFPRRHGDMMWRQFAQIRNKNITNAYVAMFDEFDEGTAIAKAAENPSMRPTDQYFLSLDADGVACSSDFYLRLTGDGAKMIKGITALAWAHPTSHQ